MACCNYEPYGFDTGRTTTGLEGINCDKVKKP
jgi:hypothetical protein